MTFFYKQTVSLPEDQKGSSRPYWLTFQNPNTKNLIDKDSFYIELSIKLNVTSLTLSSFIHTRFFYIALFQLVSAQSHLTVGVSAWFKLFMFVLISVFKKSILLNCKHFKFGNVHVLLIPSKISPTASLTKITSQKNVSFHFSSVFAYGLRGGYGNPSKKIFVVSQTTPKRDSIL